MDILSVFLSNISLGFHEALTLSNLWYCFLGVAIGCLVGVLPGLGALIAISLLLPITYHLPTTGAIIMLAGVYFGADYGGGTCSILLGVPGHAAAAVDVLDGYPMARQGRGGIALFMKCIASFFGSTFGILLLMFFAPLIAEIAFDFGPAEYCALMLLGLIACSTIGQGSPIKGIAMMSLGLLLGTIGIDVNTGILRFSFGFNELSDGINLVALAMGLFAITEVIRNINEVRILPPTQSFALRDQFPTRSDWKRSSGPILRGSILGSFFGALPGTSGGMATFLSYSIEKKLSKYSEEFGKGAIEGIAGPEACNNAGIGTAFIPTLTLGIPGDAIMALLLAGLIIQGVQPGPQILTENTSLFWGLIASFWIGNILLVFLNIPLIGLWVRLLSIPYPLLFPGIILFTCIGVYSTNNNVFDVWVLLIIALIGYLLLILRFEVIPILIGYVLGPMLEENLRRALLLSNGDFGIFFNSNISLVAVLTSGLLVLTTFFGYLRRRKGLKN